MKKLYIMCGLPFSGKTTLAKKIAEYTESKLIGFDSLWVENEKDIPKSDDGVTGWRYIRQLAQYKIKEVLNSNKSVVYDDINVRIEHREELRNIAKECHAEPTVIYINATMDLIKQREKRNKSSHQRHEVEIENFSNALAQFEQPHKNENVIEYTPGSNLSEWLTKFIDK